MSIRQGEKRVQRRAEFGGEETFSGDGRAECLSPCLESCDFAPRMISFSGFDSGRNHCHTRCSIVVSSDLNTLLITVLQ